MTPRRGVRRVVVSCPTMTSAAAPSPASDVPTFEARLASLESVVRALEGEGLSLEDSLARYQEGVEHLRACRALLDGAEARLAELVGGDEDADDLRETPLHVGEEGLVPDVDPARGASSTNKED